MSALKRARVSLAGCAHIWDGLSNQLSDKLQKFQNKAARVIICSPHDISSSSLLEEVTVSEINYINLRVKIHQFTEMFILLEERASNLRDSDGKLVLSKPRTDYLKRPSLVIVGPLYGTVYQDPSDQHPPSSFL